MIQHLYQKTSNKNLNYFEEITSSDIRSTDAFQVLKSKVLKSLERKKAQTWRQLGEKFKDRYRLNLAVESLVADNLIHIDERIINRSVIRFGGIETLADKCKKLGHSLSSKKASKEIYCLRCYSEVK